MSTTGSLILATAFFTTHRTPPLSYPSDSTFPVATYQTPVVAKTTPPALLTPVPHQSVSAQPQIDTSQTAQASPEARPPRTPLQEKILLLQKIASIALLLFGFAIAVITFNPSFAIMATSASFLLEWIAFQLQL